MVYTKLWVNYRITYYIIYRKKVETSEMFINKKKNSGNVDKRVLSLRYIYVCFSPSTYSIMIYTKSCKLY